MPVLSTTFNVCFVNAKQINHAKMMPQIKTPIYIYFYSSHQQFIVQKSFLSHTDKNSGADLNVCRSQPLTNLHYKDTDAPPPVYHLVHLFTPCLLQQLILSSF